MPHIPRRIAPTGKLGGFDIPRAEPKSSQAKPPVPYKANKAGKKPQSNRLVQRLSMGDWDVDPLKVLKHLGQEVTVDEHSRMVSNSRKPS